jgi:hypothetical protein
MVDGWINGLCASQFGDIVPEAIGGAGDAGPVAVSGAAGPWIRVVNLDIPEFWPVAVERLSAFGAPAVHLNRSNPDDPRNRDQIRRVRKHFPVSAKIVEQEKVDLIRSTRGDPKQGAPRPPTKEEAKLD